MKIVNCKLKIQLLAAFSFILVFISVLPAHAAELNFSSPRLVEDSDHLYAVNLNLDTQGDNINLLEISCRFPIDKFDLKNILTGNSIVDFWIQKPEIKNGILNLVGTIPTGYLGTNGQIITLVFQLKNMENALDVEVLNSKTNASHVFLNDPLATEKTIQPKVYSLQLPSVLTPDALTNLMDVAGPEPFTIAISPSASLPINHVFVIFNASDVDSGIDHYEMTESNTNDFYVNQDLQWQKVESPAVINLTFAKRFLAIKAVDKFNNATIASVDLKASPTKFTTSNLFTAGIVLFIIIIVICSFCYRWRIKGKNK